MTTDSDADLAPADAFAILGSDLRVDVLRALADAEREAGLEGQPYGLSFSDLYDRVEAGNTSQFAYHLDKLDGVFVHETESGYRLTDAGEGVVRAILAGTYNERPSFEPVAVDGYCPSCEASRLEATYDGETLVLSCTECDTPLLNDSLAPGQARGRTPNEVMASYSARVRESYRLALAGVCAACYGRVETEFYEVSDAGSDHQLALGVCELCGRAARVPVAFAAAEHPAVVSFYWERGVNLPAQPVWQLFRYAFGEWETERVADDPPRFAVTARHDGDDLRVELDEALDVASVEVVERRLRDDEVADTEDAGGDDERSSAPDRTPHDASARE